MYEQATLWGIHAGAMGEGDGLFLSKSNPSIAIGWPAMEDLSAIEADREAFKQRLRAVYPETKEGAVPTTAGVLYRFANELKIDDIVIYPSKVDKKVHIGKIVGDYQYSPSYDKAFPNHRSVLWYKHLPRADFSQGALYEIGSSMSLFQVKNYAEEYLAALEGKPMEAEPTEDASVAGILEVTEQSTRDFMFKKLSKELKGYSFEGFVAHILNLIGYNTRVSPKGGDGGIDIVAFKDELGIEPPIIKVQVKSTDGDVTPDKVQALYGSVNTGVSGSEYGLFVALGGYSKKAREFAQSKPNLRLIDGDELIALVIKHYDLLDSKYKAIIPLKKIYIPTQLDG